MPNSSARLVKASKRSESSKIFHEHVPNNSEGLKKHDCLHSQQFSEKNLIRTPSGRPVTRRNLTDTPGSKEEVRDDHGLNGSPTSSSGRSPIIGGSGVGGSGGGSEDGGLSGRKKRVSLDSQGNPKKSPSCMKDCAMPCTDDGTEEGKNGKGSKNSKDSKHSKGGADSTGVGGNLKDGKGSIDSKDRRDSKGGKDGRKLSISDSNGMLGKDKLNKAGSTGGKKKGSNLNHLEGENAKQNDNNSKSGRKSSGGSGSQKSGQIGTGGLGIKNLDTVNESGLDGQSRASGKVKKNAKKTCTKRKLADHTFSKVTDRVPESLLKIKNSVAEHEYLQFSLRITEDIIRNDLYANDEMKRVFNSHLEANRGRLDTDKMLVQIMALCVELNIPTDGACTLTPTNISNLVTCQMRIKSSLVCICAPTVPGQPNECVCDTTTCLPIDCSVHAKPIGIKFAADPCDCNEKTCQKIDCPGMVEPSKLELCGCVPSKRGSTKEGQNKNATNDDEERETIICSYEYSEHSIHSTDLKFILPGLEDDENCPFGFTAKDDQCCCANIVNATCDVITPIEMPQQPPEMRAEDLLVMEDDDDFGSGVDGYGQKDKETESVLGDYKPSFGNGANTPVRSPAHITKNVPAPPIAPPTPVVKKSHTGENTNRSPVEKRSKRTPCLPQTCKIINMNPELPEDIERIEKMSIGIQDKIAHQGKVHKRSSIGKSEKAKHKTKRGSRTSNRDTSSISGVATNCLKLRMANNDTASIKSGFETNSIKFRNDTGSVKSGHETNSMKVRNDAGSIRSGYGLDGSTGYNVNCTIIDDSYCISAVPCCSKTSDYICKGPLTRASRDSKRNSTRDTVSETGRSTAASIMSDARRSTGASIMSERRSLDPRMVTTDPTLDEATCCRQATPNPDDYVMVQCPVYIPRAAVNSTSYSRHVGILPTKEECPMTYSEVHCKVTGTAHCNSYAQGCSSGTPGGQQVRYEADVINPTGGGIWPPPVREKPCTECCGGARAASAKSNPLSFKEQSTNIIYPTRNQDADSCASRCWFQRGNLLLGDHYNTLINPHGIRPETILHFFPAATTQVNSVDFIGMASPKVSSMEKPAPVAVPEPAPKSIEAEESLDSIPPVVRGHGLPHTTLKVDNLQTVLKHNSEVMLEDGLIVTRTYEAPKAEKPAKQRNSESSKSSSKPHKDVTQMKTAEDLMRAYENPDEENSEQHSVSDSKKVDSADTVEYVEQTEDYDNSYINVVVSEFKNEISYDELFDEADRDDDFMKKLDEVPTMRVTTSLQGSIDKATAVTEKFRVNIKLAPTIQGKDESEDNVRK